MSVYIDNAQRLDQVVRVPDSRTPNLPIPVAQPAGPLPTHAAINWLTEAISDLDGALGALACRIEPVLSPTSPTTLASDERPSPGPAPVTASINEQANRISRLTTAVREVTNRLEI